MKKRMLFLVVATLLVTGQNMFCPYTVSAQVAIGSATDSITPGALLDLSQATDAGGLLLPQIESADTLIEELRKPGMLVYNKTDGKVYTYTGSFWSAGGSGNGGNGPLPETISVSANPSGAVQVDETQTLTATVLPVNAGWTTVNWGGNVPSVALVDAVDGSPNTATVTGIHNGTTTVTASVDGISSAPFTIVVGIPATGVSITGATSPANLAVGGKTLQLDYSITPSNSTDAVTWHSSDETVATIDNTGLVISSEATTGSTTITAKAGNITSDPFVVNVVTCGSSVMGMSGNLYPTGSYPYIQTGLKNLCWTLANLKEAGQTDTNYPGKTEDRGYYYHWTLALQSGPDFCRNGLGTDWRIPTATDWSLLTSSAAQLSTIDANAWISAPASLAGQATGSHNFNSWDDVGAWCATGAGMLAPVYTKGGTKPGWGSWTTGEGWFSVRCVRNL
ncbi:MAG: Ig-like domain-containing protein [Candidatus Symbiothrix sp.]|jgi:uncharacterized protein (TIGR02145 family)|nr:Ig-like domain-containing protein [Candidatus Symbiothrix sp.]